MSFAATLHVVLVRLSEGEGILQNLVHLDDDRAGRVEEPLICVRRAVWGMRYADDAGIVSTSAERFAKMTAVIVAVFEAAGLAVSKKKTENMLLQRRDLAPRAPPFVIEAAGQRDKQTVQFLYLGGVIDEDADLMVEVKRRVRLMRACYKQFGPELCGMTTARLSLKTRLLKAEATETLLFECVTWTLNASHYDKLRKAHLDAPQRILGSQGHADHTNLSHAKAPRVRNARASKRLPGNVGSSSLGQWHGKTRGDYPVE